MTSGRLSARRLLVELAVVPGCAFALLFLVTGKPTPAFFSLLGLAAPAALPLVGWLNERLLRWVAGIVGVLFLLTLALTMGYALPFTFPPGVLLVTAACLRSKVRVPPG